MRRLLISFALAAAFAVGSVAAKPTKPTAKPAGKPPSLQGKVVRDAQVDLEMTIPEGWEDMGKTIPSTSKMKFSTTYYNVARFQAAVSEGKRGVIYLPQFVTICMDLSESTGENKISPSEQDTVARSVLELLNETALNFRYEGSKRLVVHGEPGVAFACVATMPDTGDLIRFRVVSIFRNQHEYIFVFGADVDEFEKYSPAFAKILQSYRFLTPLKKNPDRMIVPDVAPIKKEGVV